MYICCRQTDVPCGILKTQIQMKTQYSALGCSWLALPDEEFFGKPVKRVCAW